MEFRIEMIHDTTGRATVRPQGEVDVSTAGALVDAVVTLPDPVIECDVDLSGVTFMDSSGIKAIVVCRETLHHRAAAMRILGASEGVAKLLHLTGIDQLFARDEAMLPAISN
jgi:anti-anti-sigma factor